MLIRIATRKPLSQVSIDLQAAVKNNRFGVMHIHNLKETMAKKEVDLGRECLIYEVCQPLQAKKVLDQNPALSTMLPCRISVYEENGETVLVTLKPTELVGLFNEPDLLPVAREVEDSLTKIMTGAAESA